MREECVLLTFSDHCGDVNKYSNYREFCFSRVSRTISDSIAAKGMRLKNLFHFKKREEYKFLLFSLMRLHEFNQVAVLHIFKMTSGYHQSASVLPALKLRTHLHRLPFNLRNQIQRERHRRLNFRKLLQRVSQGSSKLRSNIQERFQLTPLRTITPEHYFMGI